MLGTTRKWDRIKGYGFILPDDETQPDIFVSAKCIIAPKGRRWLLPGWRVEFDAVEVEQGLSAENVKIISRPIAAQYSATPKTGGPRS
jgi:cold shock CspA family protein